MVDDAVRESSTMFLEDESLEHVAVQRAIEKRWKAGAAERDYL